MNSYKETLTREQKGIPIPKNLSSPSSYKTDYSLNNTFFDPCKSSPPNDFMIKLANRLKTYSIEGIK